MGVVEVSDGEECDVYVSFSFGGKTYASPTCSWACSCDYSTLSTPFVVEGMVPTDFTNGDLFIGVYDVDLAFDDTIWSGYPQWDAPFLRNATNGYGLKTPDGRLLKFRFMLEPM